MIRLARKEEIDDILDIYAKAKIIMRESGNLYQWSDSYPSKELLQNDINNKNLYVIDNNGLEAVFALIGGIDKTYINIEGKWLDDSLYYTIHRIAKRSGINIFHEAIDYCKSISKHLRIDTHEDNVIMRHIVIKEGFKYCGIIHLENNDPRLAYEYSEKE